MHIRFPYGDGAVEVACRAVVEGRRLAVGEGVGHGAGLTIRDRAYPNQTMVHASNWPRVETPKNSALSGDTSTHPAHGSQAGRSLEGPLTASPSR